MIQSKKFNKKLFNEDSEMKTAKKPKRVNDYNCRIINKKFWILKKMLKIILKN